MLKNNQVWTPNGLQFGNPDAKVGKNEIILNDNDATRVESGKVGQDTENAYVEDQDSILGNDPALILNTNKTFAQLGQPLYNLFENIKLQRQTLKQEAEKQSEKFDIRKSSLAKQTAEFQNKQYQKLDDQFAEKQENAHNGLKQLADAQANQHKIVNYTYNNYMPQYKKGKDESISSTKMSHSYEMKSEIPLYQRLIPDLAALGAGAAQLAWWKNTPIQYHSTYAGNPYERRILQTLASQRYNPYPELRSAQDAERRAAYANEQSGALSGSQRYLGRLALGLGSQQSNAQILQNAQNQNINLRNNYAQMMANLGAQEAQRRMQANQHDWDDFQAAHGRKVKGIETGMYNMVNALQNAYANEFKYKSWLDSVSLYNQQLKDEDRRWIAEMQAKYPNWNLSGTKAATSKGKTEQNPIVQQAQPASTITTQTPPYVSEGRSVSPSTTATSTITTTYGPKFGGINYDPGLIGTVKYNMPGQQLEEDVYDRGVWDFGDNMQGRSFKRKIYDITNPAGGAGGLITPQPRYQYFTMPYPGYAGNFDRRQIIRPLAQYPQEEYYTHNANDSYIFTNNRSFWKSK